MKKPLMEDLKSVKYNNLNHSPSDEIPQTDNFKDGEVEKFIISQSEEFTQVIVFRDYYNILILMLNHVIAQWNAYMVVYANPGDDAFTSLEIDLNLTETEYGILSGVTYATISGVFAVVSGILVDRWSRKNILIIASILWSVLTFTQSFAVNFVTILIPRILMEISITAWNATAYSLISDYFWAKYRGRASSFYTLGLYFGVACSALTILLVNNVGWRFTYRIVSGISIFFSFLTLFINEPRRGVYNSADKRLKVQKLEKENSKLKRIWSDIKTVTYSKLFLIVWAAASLRFFGGYALGFWNAKFYRKLFPDYQNEFSIISALTTCILGVTSAYLGGAIGDYYQKTHPEAKALVSGIGPLVAFPFIVVSFTLSRNFLLSILTYSASYFPAEMWLGAWVAMIQNIFPAEIVGTAVAIFGLCGGISGAISTFLLGFLGDAFDTNTYPQTAGYLLTICVGISYLGCAPLFIVGGILYRKLCNTRWLE